MALIIAVFLTLIAAVIPVLTGGTAMTVMTGSMAPNLPPGHSPSTARWTCTLNPGDIIAYQRATIFTNGIPITDQVIAVESTGGHVGRIIVKGGRQH
jgi:signal peptidase